MFLGWVRRGRGWKEGLSGIWHPIICVYGLLQTPARRGRGNSFETSGEITARAEETVVSKGARCEIKQRMVTPFSSLARSLPVSRQI